VPRGEVPRGAVPQGEVPRGEVPRGEVPQGEVPRGEVPFPFPVNGATGGLVGPTVPASGASRSRAGKRSVSCSWPVDVRCARYG